MSGVIVTIGLIAITFYFGAISCMENATIYIDCSAEPSWHNTEIVGHDLELQPLSNIAIQCLNVRNNITFIIFQVHTYRYNVTLYQEIIRTVSSFNGTNVGMYSKNSVNKIHTFSIANFNNVTVKMYISIHAYNESAPIPGGCALVTAVDIDPTLSLNFTTDSIISVSIEAARISDVYKCGEENNKGHKLDLILKHRFYRLYMLERDYTEMEYFKNIKKMLTLENIAQYAEEVPGAQIRNVDTIKLFSAYPGTGSVYVVVAISNYGSAVYVPSHTYGCPNPGVEFQCLIFGDVLTQVVCAVMFFLGLFVCYFGHRFIKTEMFLMGTLAGAVVTYVVISQHTHLDSTAQTGAALLSGVFCGAMWWLVWWFYGLPIISVLLPTMLLGLLFAASVIFCLPDGTDLAMSSTYWPVILILTLLVPILLAFYTRHANYISCAVLGGFAVVFPVDWYVGSNLRYLAANVVRRAADPKFAYAITRAPFQINDGVVLAAWIVLSTSGFLFQQWHNSGRAPFPPPPRDAVPRATLRRQFRVASHASEPTLGRRYTPASEVTPLLR